MLFAISFESGGKDPSRPLFFLPPPANGKYFQKALSRFLFDGYSFLF